VECRPYAWTDERRAYSDARNLMIDMARTQRGRSQANQVTNN